MTRGWLTRRRLLGLAGAGVGAVAVAGLGWRRNAMREARHDLIHAILLRTVGRFEMPETEFRAFTTAVIGRFRPPSGFIAATALAAEHLGIPDLFIRSAGQAGGEYAAYCRQVTTSLLVWSDIREELPGTPLRLSFAEMPSDACRSPFARFDFD